MMSVELLPLQQEKTISLSKDEVYYKAYHDPERQDLPSASNIESFYLCPGKYHAEKGLKDIPNSDSIRGERIHAYLAGDHNIVLDEEDQILAERCYDQAKLAVIDWKSEVITKNNIDPKSVTVLKEQRYWMEDAKLNKELSGKADVVLLGGEKISHGLIIDYKTGRNEAIESAMNEQLRTLAILLFEEYPELEEVRVGIVQPLVSYEPQVCDYDLNTITQGYVRLLKLLIDIKKPDAPRIAGARQCKFCKAKIHCKEANDMMILANVSNSQLEVTPQQMAELLNRSEVAQMLCDTIKEKAKEMDAKGIKIPGYESKPGNQRRAIENEKEAFEKVQEFLDFEEFRKCFTVKVPALENMLGKKLGLTGKKIKEKLEELLGDSMIIEQNAPSLKRI